MARISSPAARPDFAEGVPGSDCKTITRPGITLTTLPKPLLTESCILLSWSKLSGERKTEWGSRLRNMPGIAPE